MDHPLHEKAKKLAVIYRGSENRLLETLMTMAEENLFIKMGFTGMWEYLLKELKISESQSSYFHRVAQRARTVPELKEAVLNGSLSISKARRIVGVINPENAAEWIAAAIELKQKELERKIADESPRRLVREGFTPISQDLSKLTVIVTLEEEKKIDRARNLLSQALRRTASLEETLDASVTLFLEKKDPVKRAERASLRTPQTGNSGGMPSTRAIPLGSRNISQQVRRPIPAAIKHQVHLRDSFRCTHRDQNNIRCENERFLELHHITAVSLGGRNTFENLTTYCSSHHRGEHLEVPRFSMAV